MDLLKGFFSSEIWQNISSRVFATFGFSGVATIATALPSTLANEITINQNLLTYVQITAITCSVMSSLVALTVLYKFIYWYKHKDKKSIENE